MVFALRDVLSILLVSPLGRHGGGLTPGRVKTRVAKHVERAHGPRENLCGETCGKYSLVV